MKKIILLALLLCAGLAGAQKIILDTTYVVKSGQNFTQVKERVFEESWRNKYRHGDPAAGPAYFGSTTFLAWTTDAKHLFGTLHRTTLFGSAVVISIGQRRPAWHYLIDAGISFVAFSAGFHGVYSVAFNQ